MPDPRPCWAPVWRLQRPRPALALVTRAPSQQAWRVAAQPPPPRALLPSQLQALMAGPPPRMLVAPAVRPRIPLAEVGGRMVVLLAGCCCCCLLAEQLPVVPSAGAPAWALVPAKAAQWLPWELPTRQFPWVEELAAVRQRQLRRPSRCHRRLVAVVAASLAVAAAAPVGLLGSALPPALAAP